jgi:predicted RNase H-like HicB family nuclease
MLFRIVICTASEGGYWARVPEMPGCATQGETIAELLANVAEAIEGWDLTDNR